MTDVEEVVPINTPQQDTQDTRLLNALSTSNPSTRLKAALAAGTHPDVRLIEPLLQRCAIEPDFFVRDMLTWALTRHPAEVTVPTLLTELHSEAPQARSQALHTLSKIGDCSVWPEIPDGLVHDSDDEVARSAWRAGVVLVPPGREGELAAELATELGRGDRDVQLSLSQALITLGDTVLALLENAMASSDPVVRAHAKATERLLFDPDSAFIVATEEAKRIMNAGTALPEGS